MAVLGITLVLGEMISRWGLGLGDPPLSIPHPTIEYMFKPGQDARRFGNRFKVNHFGMRSDPAAPGKIDPQEFRLLCLGDSVINGGNLTDHDKLATTLVQQRLRESMGRPVWVGNASAGSWGPANLLAYVREYGLFDADAIVVVINSEDAADVPTFEMLNPDTHPISPPASALGEAVGRYGLPRLKRWWGSATVNPPLGEAGKPAHPAALRAFEELLDTLGRAETPVVVFWQPNRDHEFEDRRLSGYQELREATRRRDIRWVELDEHYRQSPLGYAAAYRDPIHPSDQGQELIARKVIDEVLALTGVTLKTGDAH